MAKGCVYIPKTGKDAGKVFGSKDSLAAHMNYTPAMADVMARYEKTGGAMNLDSVTKWLTDNGYLKAEAKKPTTTGEDIKSFFSNIGNQNLAIMEADILKAGKSVISNISKATPEQRKKIDASIEQLKNKYPERNITSRVENGNLIVESGVAAPKSTEGTKKETPGISKSEQAGLEILNKYGVQRFTDWLTNQPLVGGFFGIRDIANKYGIKFPQTEKEFDAEVKKNGGIDNYMGSMAETFMSKMKQAPAEKKPTAKKEFPKAPVTDAVKTALKSVDNTTAAIMNLAKVLPTVYESIAKQVKLGLGKPASQQIAEAYHNAVENGVEPELVAAVENAVALQEQMKSKPSMAGDIETAETLEVEGVPNGVRVSNKASMAELERRNSGNATKKATIAMARAAAKTLKSVFPMMDIHLHENTADYNNAMSNLNAQRNTAGNFTYSTSSDGTVVGRIDIDLNKAVPRTVAHEVVHAVLLKTFGDSSPAFLEFRKNLEKIVSKSGNARLQRFVDQYKDVADETGQAEEYLAELGGILSDKETPLDYGLVRRIAEMINKAVSAITFGRLKPFEDLQNQKDTLEFFNTIAQSIKAGSSLENLMVAEPYSSSIAIEVDPDGTFTKSKIKTKASIGDYIIPKGKKDLAVATVPTKSLAEVIKEYNGRVVIITSDATGYGVDSKGREIYGGPGFANNKKNVDDEIGFASLNIGTVKSTYTAAENIYGQGKTLVLIMVQPPHTTINNSYGTRYFMESLVKIAKNKNWQDVKNDIKTRISTLNKITNEIGDENVAKMMAFFDKINSKSDSDALTEEYLNFTTFPARSVIAKTLMFDHPGKGVSVNTAKSKLAFLDIGVTIYDFLKEYGDQTILTDEMMKEDIGGFVVAGFEIDVTDKDTREKLIVETQGKGIAHPLFNAKLPGTNHFVLDGLYGVNENFARFSKTNTEIALPTKERDQMVREIYTKTSNYAKPIQSKINAISQNPTLSDEEKNAQIEKLKIYTNLSVTKKVEFKEKYLSKIEGALVTIMPNVATSVAQSIGFIPEKGAEKRIEKAKYTISRQLPPSKIKSKAQILGLTGAASLDNAEKIMGNLEVAKKMEQDLGKQPLTPGKARADAQKIKMATGWERGADKLWRLEIPDATLKDFEVSDLPKYMASQTRYAKLGDIIDAPELFKAYSTPRGEGKQALKDVVVEFLDTDDFRGAFTEKTQKIQISTNENLHKSPREMFSTMLHEIQHYIQFVEGFEIGSTDASMSNVPVVELQIRRRAKALFNTYNQLVDETKQPGANISEIKEELKVIQSQYSKLKEEIAKPAKDLYKRAAGEVEARNVQRRMGLTNEERMGMLLLETEDVYRADQLLLSDAIQTTNLKSKAQMADLKPGEEVTLKDGNKVVPTSISGQTKFFHASSKKRDGRLRANEAPQWGKAIYFATSRQAATDEFGGDNVTEAGLNLKNPVYTNTKEFKGVDKKAVELYNKAMLPKILKEEAELVNGKWKFFDEDLQAEYDKNGYIDKYSSSDIEEGKYFGQAAKELGHDAIIDEGGQYGTEIAVLDENAVIYPEDVEVSQAVSDGDVISVTTYNEKAKKLAHAVKDGDADAINIMAKEMAAMVPANAVLIPMPSRSGRATNMKDLAEAISKITGAPVADVLTGKKRKSLYEAKKKGETISADDLKMQLIGKLPNGKVPVVVDNVLATGATFKAAKEAIPNAKIVVHSVDQLAQPTLKSKAQMASVEETANVLENAAPDNKYGYGQKHAAFSQSGLAWHGGESIIKKFDKDKIKGGFRGELGYGYYFGTSSKPFKYGSAITFVDLNGLNLVDGETQLTDDIKSKLKEYIDSKKGSSSIRDMQKSLYAEKLIKYGESSVRDATNRINGEFAGDASPLFSELMTEIGYDGMQVSDNWQLVLYPQDKLNDALVENPNKFTAEKYVQAKEDGSNPKLIEAVENVIAKPTLKSKAQMVDNNAKEVADLYAQMREGGGWAERQKINAILDQDPKLSYIYNNFKAITQMLEDAELLTKSGNCP